MWSTATLTHSHNDTTHGEIGGIRFSRTKKNQWQYVKNSTIGTKAGSLLKWLNKTTLSSKFPWILPSLCHNKKPKELNTFNTKSKRAKNNNEIVVWIVYNLISTVIIFPPDSANKSLGYLAFAVLVFLFHEFPNPAPCELDWWNAELCGKDNNNNKRRAHLIRY